MMVNDLWVAVEWVASIVGSPMANNWDGWVREAGRWVFQKCPPR